MPSKSKPSWIKEEAKRSEVLVEKGETVNNKTPVMEKVSRAPKRAQKPIYIQPRHARAFDKLVFSQKLIKGKRAPELAEEAIEDLLAKYGAEM